MSSFWITWGPSREENFRFLQEELWHLTIHHLSLSLSTYPLPSALRISFQMLWKIKPVTAHALADFQWVHSLFSLLACDEHLNSLFSFFSSAQSFFLHSHVCLQWKALTKSGRLHWSHSSIKFVLKPFPGFWKMLESLRQQEAHSIREKAGHWSMLLLMGSYQISLVSRFFEKSDTWRGGLNICADRVLWGKICAGRSAFPAFFKRWGKGFCPRISNETIFWV